MRGELLFLLVPLVVVSSVFVHLSGGWSSGQDKPQPDNVDELWSRVFDSTGCDRHGLYGDAKMDYGPSILSPTSDKSSWNLWGYIFGSSDAKPGCTWDLTRLQDLDRLSEALWRKYQLNLVSHRSARKNFVMTAIAPGRLYAGSGIKAFIRMIRETFQLLGAEIQDALSSLDMPDTPASFIISLILTFAIPYLFRKFHTHVFKPENQRQEPKSESLNHESVSQSHESKSPSHESKSPSERSKSQSEKSKSQNHESKPQSHQSKSPSEKSQSQKSRSPSSESKSHNQKSKSQSQKSKSQSQKSKSPSSESKSQSQKSRSPGRESKDTESQASPKKSTPVRTVEQSNSPQKPLTMEERLLGGINEFREAEMRRKREGKGDSSPKAAPAYSPPQKMTSPDKIFANMRAEKIFTKTGIPKRQLSPDKILPKTGIPQPVQLDAKRPSVSATNTSPREAAGKGKTSPVTSSVMSPGKTSSRIPVFSPKKQATVV